jgi:hypothetical protein
MRNTLREASTASGRPARARSDETRVHGTLPDPFRRRRSVPRPGPSFLGTSMGTWRPGGWEGTPKGLPEGGFFRRQVSAPPRWNLEEHRRSTFRLDGRGDSLRRMENTRVSARDMCCKTHFTMAIHPCSSRETSTNQRGVRGDFPFVPIERHAGAGGRYDVHEKNL